MAARFTRADLDAFAGTEVPDLLPVGGIKLLFVGINPGLWTAAVQTHFAHPGNRFYPALYAGAIIEEPIDPAAGMTDAQRTMMTSRGIAITNLVRRATARADELSPSELTEGGLRLRRLVAERAPRVVAVAGITAYRTAFGDRSARVGRQPVDWGSSQVWVVPNPSGLNAHETVVTLAAAYRAAAVAARVVGEPTPAV